MRSTPSAKEYAQYAAESRYMNVVMPNITWLTRVFKVRSLFNLRSAVPAIDGKHRKYVQQHPRRLPY
jgi:hypothetical protein